ncbi:MAG: glycosyltransferase family 4 protein [Chloroflexi bacterium]|nr:glycosyltransferase family 4 protein [Chloroflexota bacterium]MYF64946.1 glycosyltransferase family 4 protein [Chloroflexota bacterium]MYK35420.1 glycosyltransferase family 4 protein [Chloroflexota bacterium]
MRIAQITSVYIPVPPPTHGGTEMMVSHLTEELVRRGHEVRLHASGDSSTAASLRAVTEQATLGMADVTLYIEKELEARNAFEAYRSAGEVDVVHAHWPVLAQYFAQFTATPTLLTYHYIERHLHEYYRRQIPSLRPVCVSRRQAELLGEPDLPVVYNGLDVERIPFGETAEDYVVLVARMTPTKGIVEAIRIARAAGERLVLIGPVSRYLPWSRAFYEEEVLPHVDGDRVTHIEEAPNTEVLDIVSRAKAFLFPLQWDEPFGLAAAEAMACGTPVVTYARGSMPELVEDGVSGCIVASEEEAVAAIARASTLDRRAVRSHVEGRFTVERMVDGYEALYRECVG